jgi:uncharacterized protein YceH (UPF0502 family)
MSEPPHELPPSASPADPPPRRWLPLSAVDRRVVGVLAEKAKTTPDIYPMSLNAICTGCNQKSNRSPLMQLEPEEVEEALDRLRQVGAVGMVEGYGRVQKYRHYLYEWLGVDKVELAVMTELLLRGDQTVGDLRGRAARMEPISDLAALRPVLESLKTKGLVISLSPEGRGHVVTHALLKPREIENLRAKYEGAAQQERVAAAPPADPSLAGPTPPRAATPVSRPVGGSDNNALAILQRGLTDFQKQIAELRSELDEVRAAQSQISEEMRALKEAIGG